MANYKEFESLDWADSSKMAENSRAFFGSSVDSFMPLALDIWGNDRDHIPLDQILKKQWIADPTEPKWLSPQHKKNASNDGKWTKSVLAMTERKRAILSGNPTTPVNKEYKALMASSAADRAKMLIGMGATAWKAIFPHISKATALKIGVCMAYSKIRESIIDPLSGEGVVYNYRNNTYVRNSYGGKYGTGVGLQQWSFGRQDCLFANLNNWKSGNAVNHFDLLPSLALQIAYHPMEHKSYPGLLKNVAPMLEEGLTINETLARFLLIQMGAGAGYCLGKTLIPQSLVLNEMKIIPVGFEATASGVYAAARALRPTGGCPPNKIYGPNSKL